MHLTVTAWSAQSAHSCPSLQMVIVQLLYVFGCVWAVALGLLLIALYGSGTSGRPRFDYRTLAVFAKQFAALLPQIQKAYDWHIAQWAAFSTTLLTASLGLIVTCVVETAREDHAIKLSALTLTGVFCGITAALALCGYAHLRIRDLRREFIILNVLLSRIKKP